MKLILFVVSTLLSTFSFYLPAYAQKDCASISNPQLMFDCAMKQRQDSQPLDNSEPLDLGKTPKINDWKKVGPIDNGRAYYYYSPGTMQSKRVRDTQAALGSSQVIVVYTLQDFIVPQGKGADKVSSYINTALFHCNHPNIKDVKYEAYSGKMATGKIVNTVIEPGDKNWESLGEGEDVIRKVVRSKCPAGI
jgi:hypothetical protein